MKQRVGRILLMFYFATFFFVLFVFYFAAFDGEYKNLAIANRSRVSCAHNTLRALIGLNITP